MKQLLTVCVVAALLVGGWLLFATGDPVVAGTGLGEASRRDPSRPVRGDALTQPETRPIAGPTGIGPTGVAVPNRDLTSLAAEHGVVGEAVLDLIERMKGTRLPPVDRKFALVDIARIVNAWQREPMRQGEDMTFILGVWKQVDDPAVRYALSWLFERTQDARCIPALLDLKDVDATRMLDAMAAIPVPEGPEMIADLYRDGDLPRSDPALRQRALNLLALRDWEGSIDLLERSWTDRSLDPLERVVAIESLSQLDKEPEASQRALEIAMGPAERVRMAADRLASHPESDLRSPAVQAVMALGETEHARRLLEATETTQDRDLQRMVERHIGIFQGPDLSNYLVTRCRRTQRVSKGIALYLSRSGRSDLRPEIQALRRFATDDETKQLLDVALGNASR